MRWLFLLPWLLFLLGLLPLAQGEALGQVERGLALFVVGLLLAAAASLYSRFPVGFRVQFALVLGLGLLASAFALESAWAFTGREGFLYTALAGSLGVAALGAAFFLGTGREAPLLPALEGVGTREDLLRLAGALEGLALRRELVLVYFSAPLPPERLVRELRRGDLAFRLEGGYLLVLQGSRPEDAAGLLKRLKERFPLAAYAVERWRGGSLERVLARLEAESLLQT
ncbi:MULTISPECIES: hypothetical protein [Thermus]|uniref:hypothetical protein n=1 Tax=Thermus TaxID=270 RepID=UPI001F27F8F1|nr:MULTISPECIES: hypothetical protein [Thermus]